MTPRRSQATEITLTLVEGGPEVPIRRTVETFRQADSIIWCWRKKAPDDGSYLKADVEITWANGYRYRDQIELTRYGPVALATWVRRVLSLLASSEIGWSRCPLLTAGGPGREGASHLLDECELD